MKYEIAQKRDLPSLTSLWQRCFGDSEASVKEFWKVFDQITVFIAREKQPVAMLCALPVTYFDEAGEALPASYLYAICTDSAYRKQGICAQLMAYAERTLKNTGSAFAFLTPASDDLFDFYRKMGYQTAFYHERTTLAAGGTAKIQPIDTAAYQNLRQMQLYSEFVSYDDAILGLQRGLYRVETAEVVCCSAAEKHGEELLIKEILPYDASAACALASHLGCKNASVRSIGAQTPFAMAKSLGEYPIPENAYLGFAFD